MERWKAVFGRVVVACFLLLLPSRSKRKANTKEQGEPRRLTVSYVVVIASDRSQNTIENNGSCYTAMPNKESLKGHNLMSSGFSKV